MRLSIVVTLLMASCGRPTSAPQPDTPRGSLDDPATFPRTVSGRTGELRGVEEISQLIRRRWLSEADPLSDLFHVDTVAGGAVASVSYLLGAYDGQADAAFRNAEPNPFNMLVWHRLFDGLADALGELCVTPGDTLTLPRSSEQDTFTLDADLVALMPRICELPATDPARTTALESYWRQLMGYDAPSAELDAWLEFAASLPQGRDAEAAKERVHALTTTLLMNPYFVLTD